MARKLLTALLALTATGCTVTIGAYVEKDGPSHHAAKPDFRSKVSLEVKRDFARKANHESQ